MAQFRFNPIPSTTDTKWTQCVRLKDSIAFEGKGLLGLIVNEMPETEW
jgi:hypothetical protein